MTFAPAPTSSPLPPQAAAASRFPRSAGVLWWLPLFVAALAGGVAFVLTDRQALEYESRTALLAPEDGPLTPEILVAEIQSDAVFAATIRTLQLDTTVAALRDRIDVGNTGVVIEILARAPSAADARLLARTFANEARDPRVSADGGVLTVSRQAQTPDGPLKDDAPRNAAAAVAGGLLVGVTLALLIAGREGASQHRLDVSGLTGWPVLGTIPHSGRAGAGAPGAYARLQEVVDAQRLARGFRILLVTGVEDGDGATTVAVNLALASARAGVDTTLVDADLADPAVHQALGIGNDAGLTDSLEALPAPADGLGPTSPAYAPLALQRLAPADSAAGAGTPGGSPPRLRVLTAGPVPDSPETVLQGRRVGEILLELAGASTLVIVNGPPLELPASVGVLTQQCEATLVVVNALTGNRELVAEAAAGLGSRNRSVIGAVVTRSHDTPAAVPSSQTPPASVLPVSGLSKSPGAARLPGPSFAAEPAADAPLQSAPARSAPARSDDVPARPPMGWPPPRLPGSSTPREIPRRPQDR